MFDYVDPTGTGVLEAEGALSVYRDILDSFYDSAVMTPATRFVGLEDIPIGSNPKFVDWPAFPVTATASDQEIDEQRFKLQDEYVEWQVQQNPTGGVSSITFTTDFPEYFQALAEVSEAALIVGIQGVIPEANPTTEELFGPSFDPKTASPSERAAAFRNVTTVGFGSGATSVSNPWNNGDKGILCLGQQFNTMGALFNLARLCAVPNPGIPPSSQCSAVGGACGPSRSSDPRICSEAQSVSRIPLSLSLQDPVGITIRELKGNWRQDGVVIDINSSTHFSILRNGRRAVLNVNDGLTLDGLPVQTGAQVSKLLDVALEVIPADPAAAVIASARATNPVSQRTTTLLSRTPSS